MSETEEALKKRVDRLERDTLILELTTALREIMDAVGETETVYYIAKQALELAYPDDPLREPPLTSVELRKLRLIIPNIAG